MSKFTSLAKKPRTPKKAKTPIAVGVTHNPTFTSTAVRNYMASTGYTLDPIAKVRMILASSIFGEPAYYESAQARTELAVNAINEALDYNFDAAIHLAVELRRVSWHRLNPQIILALASIHPRRAEWSARNPGRYAEIMAAVARRPDDITGIIEYLLVKLGGKNGIPGIVKRGAAKVLADYNAYQINKYKNNGIGLPDVVRITHAKGEIIDQLMRGTLQVSEADQTPRSLKSQGHSWQYILNSGVRVTHDDYLYNLRGMLSELGNTREDRLAAEAICRSFVAGAVKSNIWPYKYWVAYKQLSREEFNYKAMALDAISDALDQLVDSKRVSGRVDVLADNSGSARSGRISEANSANVYEVGNLSAVITARQYTDGRVYVFGDKCIQVPINRRDSIISQVTEVNNAGMHVGQSTEHGIWLYFNQMINQREDVDSVFVYSDMQAGTGGLFGNASDYAKYQYNSTRYIDVWKLVETLRSVGNRYMNMFCIQIAGYDNSIMPENTYRGANLSGWSGKELEYAKEITAIWDQVENV